MYYRLPRVVHDASCRFRAFSVPERLGLPSGLLSAAPAFLPTSLAKARCRSANE